MRILKLKIFGNYKIKLLSQQFSNLTEPPEELVKEKELVNPRFCYIKPEIKPLNLHFSQVPR